MKLLQIFGIFHIRRDELQSHDAVHTNRILDGIYKKTLSLIYSSAVVV